MIARVLAVVTIALGIGILIRTLALGGGGLAYGFLFGGVLVFAGVLRLYLSGRMGR
jgi:hypothetical protein